MFLPHAPLRLAARARGLPTLARYAATVAFVLGTFAIRRAADDLLPPGYPFLVFFVAILFCAALFDRGSGFVATLTSAALVLYFYVPPVRSFVVEDPRDLLAAALFIAIGATITLVIEALHGAIARMTESERSRTLILREFRHRTRNDLNALVALLQLRARTAPSEAAREGLLEAAGYAFALARVHTRLAPDLVSGDPAEVDTREFVTGLCADIEAAQFGGGLRPVVFTAEAEPHPLASDRAVPLGLVLNEAVTNALKYAFPEDGTGTVAVRFRREGADYVLTVVDDGIGPPEEGELEGGVGRAGPPGSGLGTRLLRGLAAQLRGRLTRERGEGGQGTAVTLRFPVGRPGS